MPAPFRSDPPCRRAGPIGAAKTIASLWTLTALLAIPAPAAAVDGCLVLLCLAAPDWRQVPMCVPAVRQVLRDLARGRPFPQCKNGGAGNTSAHEWSRVPDFCPPQYLVEIPAYSGPHQECLYAGAITVWVDGAVFTRTWWSFDEDTVTEYSPAAKAQLGTWETRFDDDYAAWLAAQPPTDPQWP